MMLFSILTQAFDRCTLSNKITPGPMQGVHIGGGGDGDGGSGGGGLGFGVCGGGGEGEGGRGGCEGGIGGDGGWKLAVRVPVKTEGSKVTVPKLGQAMAPRVAESEMEAPRKTAR